MKIFYAIQATGNGHIARAAELMPYLQQYGEVDVFLSGSNSHLDFPLPIKYRSKGISLLYNTKGGLDYKKIIQHLQPLRAFKEARDLPIEKYDVVINDFDCITALASKLKKVPTVNFGHQASFQSRNTPRPAKKDWIGEWVLKHYGAANAYIGLHFRNYDNFIFSPIVKNAILNTDPTDKGHITVYLSHYSDEVLLPYLHKIPDVKFEVFSKKAKAVIRINNVELHPINNQAFTHSMVNSTGVITGAGFEAPAEALYLNKKLLCLPIKGQYEQLCNAEALKSFNVPVLPTIKNGFEKEIENWLDTCNTLLLQLPNNHTYHTVQHVIETARAIKHSGSHTGLLTPSALAH